MALRYITLCALVAGASTIAPAAHAADAPPAAADSGEPALEAITVTAQRRTENLQDVPIAVTAVSATQLAANGITDLEDLALVVPGLTFSNTQGNATPRLRGVGSSAFGPGIEPETAVYVDGVYYASSESSLFSFNNIEQVAVLKGPQGTLFGRNAVAGLVQITTKDPTQEFHGDVSAGYGSYRTETGSVYVTGGLTDTLAADFALQATHQGEGYGRNLATGAEANKIDHEIAARSKFLWKPAEGTRVALTLDYADSAGSTNDIRLDRGTTPGAGTGPAYGGSPWDIAADNQPYTVVTSKGAAVKVDQDFGTLRFSSISAYRTLDYHNTFDLDATAAPFQAFAQEQHDRQISQEFQLQSPRSSAIQWTTGFFYFNSRGSYAPLDLLLTGGPTGNPQFPVNLISTQTVERTKSYALYGQATKEILPQTNLTLGIRDTQENRSLDGTQTVDIFTTTPVAVVSTPAGNKISSNKPTWRVSLDHHFTDAVMSYLSYNRGYKSGGFNAGSVTDAPFKPETLDAFELGTKTELLNRRLSVNAAGFYYDYKNIQTQYIEPGGAIGILNGAKAKIYGLDADLSAAVTTHFKVNAGIEMLHSKFASFPTDAPLSTAAGGVPVVLGSATGHELPIAPKFTESLGGNYSLPIAVGVVDVNAAVDRNSGWYTEVDNVVRQPAFTMVNAAVRWTSPDATTDVSLWGDNLSNEAVRTNGTTISYGNHVSAYAPPRTYGVKLNYRF